MEITIEAHPNAPRMDIYSSPIPVAPYMHPPITSGPRLLLKHTLEVLILFAYLANLLWHVCS